MTQTYKISTIKDIFDKVPAERIEDCCKELGTILRQSAVTRDLLYTMVLADGIEIGREEVMRMPDEIEWVDDGSGDLEFSLTHDGENLLSVKTKVGQCE